MTYPQTGSRLENFISTGLSTAILVEVDNKRVGAIQSMTIDQSRSVEGVREVGSDAIIERVPNSAAEVELDVERIVFDGLSLPVAFGRPFNNIHSQRIPFTIKVFDTTYAQTDAAPDFSAVPNSAAMIIHEYSGCWFTSLSSSYTAREYIITQRARITCENVVTYFANGTTSPAIPGPDFFSGYNGGTDSLQFNIETVSDVSRRGTLDAAGLGLLLNDRPIFGNQ